MEFPEKGWKSMSGHALHRCLDDVKTEARARFRFRQYHKEWLR